MPPAPSTDTNGSRFVGIDGREYVSIQTSKHRAFAAACLAELSRNDGRDRKWMLQHSAVTVPVEILDVARSRLEAGNADPPGVV